MNHFGSIEHRHINMKQKQRPTIPAILQIWLGVLT